MVLSQPNSTQLVLFLMIFSPLYILDAWPDKGPPTRYEERLLVATSCTKLNLNLAQLDNYNRGLLTKVSVGLPFGPITEVPVGLHSGPIAKVPV